MTMTESRLGSFVVERLEALLNMPLKSAPAAQEVTGGSARGYLNRNLQQCLVHKDFLNLKQRGVENRCPP
ncbi:hypothetical protein D3C80_2126320 [compost metagenome]